MGLLEIIGTFFFVVGMAEYSAEMAKHHRIKIKPFNCSYCLTFWIGVPLLHWFNWGMPLEIKWLIVNLGYLFIIRQIVWRHLY